jgi:hypothetical protein
MKNIFSLLLIALSTTAIAQPGKTGDTPIPPPLSFEEMQLPPVREPEMYKNFSDQIKNGLNGDPGPIMGIMSDELRMQYPENKFSEYLKEIKNEYGNIQEVHFLTMSGKVARYEATFDKKKQVLLKLGTDNEGRLSVFSLSPFKPESVVAPIERNTTKLSLPFTGEWYVLSG